MEERFIAVKVAAGDLPALLREALRGSEGECGEGRRGVGKAERGARGWSVGVLEGLVFVSDGHDFHDHICFDYGLLECPEKLFDLLQAAPDAPPRPLLDALRHPLSLPATRQALLQAPSREEMARVVVNYLRQEVLLRFREGVAGQAVSVQLEEEKKRKKDFSVHWKFLSEEGRQRLLMLGKSSLEGLRELLLHRNIPLSVE